MRGVLVDQIHFVIEFHDPVGVKHLADETVSRTAGSESSFSPKSSIWTAFFSSSSSLVRAASSFKASETDDGSGCENASSGTARRLRLRNLQLSVFSSPGRKNASGDRFHGNASVTLRIFYLIRAVCFSDQLTADLFEWFRVTRCGLLFQVRGLFIRNVSAFRNCMGRLTGLVADRIAENTVFFGGAVRKRLPALQWMQVCPEKRRSLSPRQCAFFLFLLLPDGLKLPHHSFLCLPGRPVDRKLRDQFFSEQRFLYRLAHLFIDVLLIGKTNLHFLRMNVDIHFLRIDLQSLIQ